MPWKVNVDGQSVMLDDLTAEELYDACVDYPEITWMQMWNTPAAHPSAFYKLVEICARKLGQQPPYPPRNIRETTQFVVDHLERVDNDDLPDLYGEGGVPLEAPDETETTGSSTSTGPEDGTQTRPDEPE